MTTFEKDFFVDVKLDKKEEEGTRRKPATKAVRRFILKTAFMIASCLLKFLYRVYLLRLQKSSIALLYFVV